MFNRPNNWSINWENGSLLKPACSEMKSEKHLLTWRVITPTCGVRQLLCLCLLPQDLSEVRQTKKKESCNIDTFFFIHINGPEKLHSLLKTKSGTHLSKVSSTLIKHATINSVYVFLSPSCSLSCWRRNAALKRRCIIIQSTHNIMRSHRAPPLLPRMK